MKADLPIIELTSAELAYIAGLLDGEGCLDLFRRRPDQPHRATTYNPRIQVGMTDQPTIAYLHAVFGGTFTQRTIRNPRHKPQWTWTVVCGRALLVLAHLLPYLRIKRRQAEILLAFGSLKWRPGPAKGSRASRPIPLELRVQRDVLYEELAALNKRGNHATGS